MALETVYFDDEEHTFAEEQAEDHKSFSAYIRDLVREDMPSEEADA